MLALFLPPQIPAASGSSSSSWPFFGHFPVRSHHCCTEEIQNWTQRFRCWAEGKDQILWPAATLPSATQDTFSLPNGKVTLLAHLQLDTHLQAQVLLCEVHEVHGFTAPQVQDFAFPRVELHFLNGFSGLFSSRKEGLLLYLDSNFLQKLNGSETSSALHSWRLSASYRSTFCLFAQYWGDSWGDFLSVTENCQ